MGNKIVLAVSGASGAIYARQALQKLQSIRSQWEALSVVMSDNAKEVWRTELGDADYEKMDLQFYSKKDFCAPFASGSASYNIMIVLPCSMGLLSRIAHGVSDDLITRAADVMLKEKRKLILGIREMPYNLIHIKNMELVTLAGGIICPASPSYYSMPKNIEELASTVTDRILSLAGFHLNRFKWGE
ncbi:MAG: UbiX family flavin prenyltransferase [Bacteroidetes bacterium]|nr:UbiX family flavin prenyltransferase [Bacteroidota bacterium]